MKKWIKNISIGFLAVILAFTFLSRALASVTTAVVFTQKPVSGKISHSVSASGKIETTQEIAVTLPGQRTVEAVYIQAGDQVETGDMLFRLSENIALAEAEEAFSVWEIKALMTLETAANAYLAAYENWQKYLGEIAGSSLKSTADNEESDLEKAMREAQYEYFVKYKLYLEDYVEWQEKALENSGTIDVNVKKARREVLSAWKQMQAAKEDYYEYQRSQEKAYQDIHTEEKTKRQEALEAVILDYEDALTLFESELSEKAKNILNASDGLADDGIVYANMAGTVKEVNLLMGDQTANSAALILALDTEQKKVIVKVSGEYEEYLALGDNVILKKYGETEAIQGAEVTDIQYDEDDSRLLKVTVTVTSAELELGDQVEVTFDNQSEQYGMLISVNAIYSQNNETYVLVVQEAEGILGTVLEAKKVSVDILDKNNSYAAISATGASGQDIIVQSDREVRDGGRVRKQVS